ncbi:Low temperature requirement protein LtrA [Catalinimonas alkaloidigena]|uniref:Low temperature requirement protein LtrA n=2 Tax=Catalinimonas alkaloidigena TaxID=1075417 RepID=A0A1G9KS35_9BACT|nr:Low temperature requirement protein LtrA [Catalinimonas alkaloidigena]
MHFGFSSAAWWGPPKKFDQPERDRRVSWLELFYDLVYVIAISRITHHFSEHVSLGSFFEYAGLFCLIFWGWLNGSLYYDLHGNEGLRTRLMTLWQMMIIAALSITLSLPDPNHVHVTVVFMVMQFFITYLWWSVGFYDPSHRPYSRPYTVLYLLSLGLMGLSLVFPERWLTWLLPVVLVCNYAPPFISQGLLRRSSRNIDMTPSMFERLGLFTIIVFGELVLGVINGVSDTQEMDFLAWLNFALALAIIFALWWIFFTLVWRGEAQKGFIKASALELLYIPPLITLGLMAVSFTSFFDPHEEARALRPLFGYAVAVFLTSISLIMGLVEVLKRVRPLKRRFRLSLVLTAAVFLLSALIAFQPAMLYYLLGVLVVLVIEILYLNSLYYASASEEENEINEPQTAS